MKVVSILQVNRRPACLLKSILVARLFLERESQALNLNTSQRWQSSGLVPAFAAWGWDDALPCGTQREPPGEDRWISFQHHPRCARVPMANVYRKQIYAAHLLPLYNHS